MAQHSPARLARTVLTVALLPLGASLFAASCAGASTTQEIQPAAQVGAGDLSAVEVSLHQAVG